MPKFFIVEEDDKGNIKTAFELRRVDDQVMELDGKDYLELAAEQVTVFNGGRVSAKPEPAPRVFIPAKLNNG